jgi:LacI family transcriptional regulator
VTERAPGRQHEPAGRRQVVRLVDIATAVGVHPSTVSRVLNGEVGHSLRPETVERILTEARARGYRPNALARALRQHRTGALTFVVPMLRNPIWVRLQRGALLRAAERGYVVMIMLPHLREPRRRAAARYRAPRWQGHRRQAR